MIWTQPKQFGFEHNNLYPSKTIWAVQNHFGPIEGQGISILLKKGGYKNLSIDMKDSYI